MLADAHQARLNADQKPQQGPGLHVINQQPVGVQNSKNANPETWG